jgi:hypothetical protein
MPLSAISSANNHKFEPTQGRAMKITVNINSILIKKDLSDSTEFEEIDIVIKHRYFFYDDREE